jgi:hypothetical protein
VKITRGDPAQITAARDQLLAEALVYFKANDNIDYIAGHYICVKDLVDRGKTPGPWLDLPVPAQEAFASVAANEAGVRHE